MSVATWFTLTGDSSRIRGLSSRKKVPEEEGSRTEEEEEVLGEGDDKEGGLLKQNQDMPTQTMV